MKCKDCQHYQIYKMITSGPYGYSGDIPCNRCIRFGKNDEFVPVRQDGFDLDNSMSD
jgi:hypothetical protein